MSKQITKAKASTAHMRATAKWEANNYDRVLIRFPKGTKDRIRAIGETVNGFTVSVVLDRLSHLEDFNTDDNNK